MRQLLGIPRGYRSLSSCFPDDLSSGLIPTHAHASRSKNTRRIGNSSRLPRLLFHPLATTNRAYEHIRRAHKESSAHVRCAHARLCLLYERKALMPVSLLNSATKQRDMKDIPRGKRNPDRDSRGVSPSIY